MYSHHGVGRIARLGRPEELNQPLESNEPAREGHSIAGSNMTGLLLSLVLTKLALSMTHEFYLSPPFS